MAPARTRRGARKRREARAARHPLSTERAAPSSWVSFEEGVEALHLLRALRTARLRARGERVAQACGGRRAFVTAGCVLSRRRALEEVDRVALRLARRDAEARTTRTTRTARTARPARPAVRFTNA